MTVKDLDHLRLWTSNVTPSRIQLQFCETKFQLFFSTTCKAGRFPVLSRISGAGTKLMAGSALSKELFRTHSCSPTSRPAAGKHIPPTAFSSLCKPFILFVEFLSLSKLNSLSQKHPVEGLTSDGSYLQRQAPTGSHGSAQIQKIGPKMCLFPQASLI